MYLIVVYFFNASVIIHLCVAAEDSCFPALVPNVRCSITKLSFVVVSGVFYCYSE
jgi:hypothetical protein